MIFVVVVQLVVVKKNHWAPPQCFVVFLETLEVQFACCSIVPSSLWLKDRVFVLGPNSTKWKIVSYRTMSIWLSLFINIALNRFLIGILYYEQERSN